MNIEQIAWAAGLFEGEGCIHHRPVAGTKYFKRVLQLTMTDRDVVYRFAEVVGAGKIHPRAPGKEGWSPQWAWRCSKWADTERILKLFLPYLGERRRTAAEALLANPAAPLGGHWRWKTHCKRGHPLVPENLYQYSDKRLCRECVLLRKRRRRQKRLAAGLPRD